MGLGLRMAVAARTATISTARMQIRMVWAIRISLVRKTIMVPRPRMAEELKTARELKTAQQLRMGLGLRMAIAVRTAINPTAQLGTRMDWATSMETRIEDGQMATVTAKAIANATAAAKNNLAT